MAISSWIEHSHVDSELLKYQDVIDDVMRNENTRRNVIVLIATVLLAVSIGATSLSLASSESATAQKIYQQ